jgi:YbbR domain-containing protein
MRRVVAFIVRNWPLKLAALVLATLLYGGLVLSSSVDTFQGRISITAVNYPATAYLIGDIPDVTSIRYLIIGTGRPQLTAASFSATIDLGAVPVRSGGLPFSVPVTVQATDPTAIQVVDFSPSRVQVRLDPLTSKVVPVQVDRGTVPEGLDVRAPVVSLDTVTVSGPESVVRLVVAAQARVRIQPSGIDVNEMVDLVAIDARGAILDSVDLEPSSVRVTIQVGSRLSTRAIPVNAVVTGTPADGYQVGSVVVTPILVTLEGEADALAPLAKVDSMPVSISGARRDVTAQVKLDLPEGVTALGVDTVKVVIDISQQTASRTFEIGVAPTGGLPGYHYALSTDSVLATFGGSVADLDALDPRRVAASVDVSDAGPGTSRLQVTIQLPSGLTLVSVAPPEVSVAVTAPPTPTPAPTATPAPTPTPAP